MPLILPMVGHELKTDKATMIPKTASVQPITGYRLAAGSKQYTFVICKMSSKEKGKEERSSEDHHSYRLSIFRGLSKYNLNVN